MRFTEAEVFGDDIVAVAMNDRLANHAEVIETEGEAFRTRKSRTGTR
jgi:hypothetical protein